MMAPDWQLKAVMQLQEEGHLLVEDGNHGEYRPRPGEFVEDGVPFIRAADIADGRVLFPSASRINDVALRRIRKGVGAPGDVLLSHKGTVGKVALVPDVCEPFVCSPQTTFWRSLNPRVLNRRYLYYFLCSSGFQRQLNAVKGETDMADYVSLTAQRRLMVAIPPLPAQDMIVSLLGALDDKIDLNRRMNQTLEIIAGAIFKSWFVDFDPVRERRPLFPCEFFDSGSVEVPRGWDWVPLSEVVKIHNAKRIPLSSRQRAERKGAYPYYGAASIVDYVDDYLFDGIFILLGEDGSVVQENGLPVLQYVWGKFWVNNHAHVLTSKGAVSLEHLYLSLTFTKVRPYVTGAVQPKLNQGNLLKVPFLLPSDGVCKLFADIVGPLFAKIRSNVDESRTLATLRDTLLPKLLSGEIRVTQADKLVGGAV